MTPREKGIEWLKKEVRNSLLTVSFIVPIAGIIGVGTFCGIYITSGDMRGPSGPANMLIIMGLFVLVTFIGSSWAIAKRHLDLKKRRFLEIERLAEIKPFSEAYRNGSLLHSETSMGDENKKRELREKYHQLKEAIDVQLKGHQREKELLQNQGKIEDAQGMAALILDLGDAEKQLQKELSLIERGYQPVQIPHIAADPSPVSRTKPTRETGLEDY